MEKKTIRNILIFITVALASGWLGLLIDKAAGPQAGENSPGMGIWLVLPLLTTILLRSFAGDGWKDLGLKPNLRENVKWYFIAILIFPIVTLATLSVGKLLNWTDFSNFKANAYFAGFVGTLGVNFIKNIFEESVWRGYLTTKLLKIKTKDIWLYLIVGGVWGTWHLPYYLHFLPKEQMFQVLPVSSIVFALVAIASMMCWSVMFVELYRITKSIWPVILMHAVEDSLVNHLIIDGYITIESGTEIFISPICGIITSVLYLAAGLMLRKKRIKSINK